ncbi:MAG: hypothetical protein H8D42_03595 [Candidatus Marinimicrobia bacterium]|nr:hypothetical protein [Candidatus Neomarinimicrobiota bacterium]MBL7204005.1 hypothetical protein [Desulfobacteraceae bacterium]
MDKFNIVVGIIGILSFVFSVGIWLWSRMKRRELSETIATIHSIAGTALWENSAIWEGQTAETDEREMRLRQSEKTLGYVNSIREITKRFVPYIKQTSSESEVGLLIERGIIVPKPKIWKIEGSEAVVEIWLVTPDLHPDSSSETTGKLVERLLIKGRNYVYFYPDDLAYKEAEVARLKKNIGITNDTTGKLAERVQLVPLNRNRYPTLFGSGNTILFFRDKERTLPPRCLEEVVLTRVPVRGAFWQEHSEDKARDIKYLLEEELKGRVQ